MSPTLIIGMIVFVCVVSLAGAAFMFIREYTGNKAIDQRLDRLTGNNTPTLAEAGILKQPLYPEDEVSFTEKYLPKLPNLQLMFEQADFEMEQSKFWGISGGLALFGIALPLILSMPFYVAGMLGALMFFMPMMFVSQKRNRRLGKIGAQLCEALELVARALRAGHSLAAGMHAVAVEMPEPIATEFGRVYEEQNLGISLEDAMRNLSDRVPNFDLRFFVTAVIIQRTTGGDLAEILDKIGYVIRERFKILGMVKALTGEGRISGVVLIALPFVLLLVLMNLNFQYVALLWNNPMGQKLSIYGIVSMIIGALAIRKIVNIKV